MRAKAALRSEPPGKREKSSMPMAAILKLELRRLHAQGLGTPLRDVVWRPYVSTDKEAEVIGEVVYVYSRDRKAALESVRHEILHFEIATCQQPFVELLNALLADVSEEAHRRAERLTERLREAMGNKDTS